MKDSAAIRGDGSLNTGNDCGLVSVLILSYMNVEGVYSTLDSVLEQTYGRIEVVISDDGTPGFKAHIAGLRDYIGKNSRGNIESVIINALDVNGGIVRNLNSAIAQSGGRYIKVMSQEDRFSRRDALEKYVEFMDQTDFLIAFAKMRGVTDDGSYKYELASCESDYELLKSYSVEDTLNRLYRRNFLPAPAWITKRELFDKYGPFLEDTRLIEDYAYWMYLCRNGVKFGYIDQVLIDYRLSGVSSGGRYSERFMQDMMIIYDKYIFPYDRRFGVLQPVYNMLKRGGLNYYMSEAKRDSLSPAQKVFSRIKYMPFHLLVKTQSLLIEKRNNSFTEGKTI